MTEPAPDPLDDLFSACALAAFLEQARAARGWPDRETTRRRAYRLYEAALAEANGPPPYRPLDRRGESC